MTPLLPLQRNHRLGGVDHINIYNLVGKEHSSNCHLCCCTLAARHSPVSGYLPSNTRYKEMDYEQLLRSITSFTSIHHHVKWSNTQLPVPSARSTSSPSWSLCFRPLLPDLLGVSSLYLSDDRKPFPIKRVGALTCCAFSEPVPKKGELEPWIDVTDG